MHSLLIVLLVYAVVVGCIFAFQRRLMYYPVKSVGAPETYGLKDIHEAFIASRDGIKLQVWSHTAREGYPTVVYFHGNAYHLGERAATFSALIDAGFGLVAVSYRGFGKSAGRPCEQGIYGDARAAIDYATTLTGRAPGQLIYFGESLGSGVAVQMASERAPALLALEAPYTSVQTRSAEIYFYVLGARFLVRDKYDSLAKIARVHAPLLILHGVQDATIPIRHGRMLYAAANEPKTMVEYPDVHHVDYSGEQIVTPLLKAAKTYGLIA